jgi:hypothetical protein
MEEKQKRQLQELLALLTSPSGMPQGGPFWEAVDAAIQQQMTREINRERRRSIAKQAAAMNADPQTEFSLCMWGEE